MHLTCVHCGAEVEWDMDYPGPQACPECQKILPLPAASPVTTTSSTVAIGPARNESTWPGTAAGAALIGAVGIFILSRMLFSEPSNTGREIYHRNLAENYRSEAHKAEAAADYIQKKYYDKDFGGLHDSISIHQHESYLKIASLNRKREVENTELANSELLKRGEYITYSNRLSAFLAMVSVACFCIKLSNRLGWFEDG